MALWDPAHLDALQQGYQAHLASQQGQRASLSQPTNKNPSFLQSMFPTIGGVGGGALGGAAGGALAGTAVLPGVGTVAGGLIGALLGGAAGGAAGKVAENYSTGQNLGSGVGGQALEQGVLSAGPLRLLKAGKVAAGAVKAGIGTEDAARAASLAGRATGASGQTLNGVDQLTASAPRGIPITSIDSTATGAGVPVVANNTLTNPSVSAIQDALKTLKAKGYNVDSQLGKTAGANPQSVVGLTGTKTAIPLTAGAETSSIIPAKVGSDALNANALGVAQGRAANAAGNASTPSLLESILGNGGAVDSALSKPNAFKTLVANKVNDSADNLAQRGLKLNGSKFNSDFAGRTGEEVGQFARRFGVPANGVEATSSKVLQPGFDAHAAAVHSVGDISKADVLSSIQQQVAKEASSKVPANQQFAKDVLQNAKGVLDNFGDTIPASELNSVKSELAAQVNHAATDTASRTNNELINRVSSGFRNAINSAADTQGVGVDPALAKLGYRSKNVGDLGEELQNLSTFLKQANVKSRVGTGSAPISLSSLPGVGTGGTVAGLPGALVGGAVSQAVDSGIGRRVIGAGADRLANRATASALGDSVKNPVGLGAIAKRSVPVGLAQALTSSASGYLGGANNDSTNTPTTMNPTANNTANMSPLSQNPQGLSSTSGGQQGSDSMFDSGNIEANVQKILANGGKLSDAAQYIAMAKQVNDLRAANNKSQELPGYSKPSASQYSQGVSGSQSVAQLQQMLSSDPGVINRNVTPGQGLPFIGSTISNAAKTGDYRAVTHNILNSIARINTGANMPVEEESFYRNTYLPQPNDSAATKQTKIGNLQSFFTPITNYPGSSGSEVDPSLLSALGVQQ